MLLCVPCVYVCVFIENAEEYEEKMGIIRKRQEERRDRFVIEEYRYAVCLIDIFYKANQLIIQESAEIENRDWTNTEIEMTNQVMLDIDSQIQKEKTNKNDNDDNDSNDNQNNKNDTENNKNDSCDQQNKSNVNENKKENAENTENAENAEKVENTENSENKIIDNNKEKDKDGDGDTVMKMDNEDNEKNEKKRENNNNSNDKSEEEEKKSEDESEMKTNSEGNVIVRRVSLTGVSPFRQPLENEIFYNSGLNEV